MPNTTYPAMRPSGPRRSSRLSHLAPRLPARGEVAESCAADDPPGPDRDDRERAARRDRAIEVSLEHIRGHLVVGVERLTRSRAEGLHAAGLERRLRLGRRAKVETTSVDDREEGAVPIEPVPAEHRAALDGGRLTELVEHEREEA